MIRVNANWGRVGYVVLLLTFNVGLFMRISTNYRYITLMAMVALQLLLLYCTKDGRTLETGVIKRMSAIFAVFIGVSILAMFTNDFAFYAGRDFFQLFMPAALAFLVYNTEPGENMDFYFDAMLFVTAFCYLYSFSSMLSLTNILSISISDSYSPFESSIASRFTLLTVYYYMRKRPVFCAVSFFLNYMAFKRINLIYAVIIILFGWLIERIKFRDIYLTIASLAFIISPFALQFMCSPGFVNWFDSTFNQTFQQFTSARLDQFVYVLGYEGSLLGLSMVTEFTTNTFWIHSFHSDLLRYSIETTILGLFVFVVCMFGMIRIRRSMMTFSLMIFAFFTMIGSILVGDFLALFGIFLLCHNDVDAVNAQIAEKRLRRKEIKNTGIIGMQLTGGG